MMPALPISPRYEEMAKDRWVDSSTHEFVGTNVHNAAVADRIHQPRKNTLFAW